MSTTTTTEAHETAEALHAEAREILRKRTALQRAVRQFNEEIAEHERQLVAMNDRIRLAIEAEGTT